MYSFLCGCAAAACILLCASAETFDCDTYVATEWSDDQKRWCEGNENKMQKECPESYTKPVCNEMQRLSDSFGKTAKCPDTCTNFVVGDCGFSDARLKRWCCDVQKVGCDQNCEGMYIKKGDCDKTANDGKGEQTWVFKVTLDTVGAGTKCLVQAGAEEKSSCDQIDPPRATSPPSNPADCDADKPVCGDGTNYPNSCKASRAGATRIMDGKCNGIVVIVVTPPAPHNDCSVNQPVCGDGKDYANMCKAKLGGATTIKDGTCADGDRQNQVTEQPACKVNLADPNCKYSCAVDKDEVGNWSPERKAWCCDKYKLTDICGNTWPANCKVLPCDGDKVGSDTDSDGCPDKCVDGPRKSDSEYDCSITGNDFSSWDTKRLKYCCNEEELKEACADIIDETLERASDEGVGRAVIATASVFVAGAAMM